MNPNLNSQISANHSLPTEGTAVGIFAAALLLAKKLFSPKSAKPESMTRADFYAEIVDLKDQMHSDHLALLDKLDANHRELLAAVERQSTRINVLETALARLDERTQKGGRTSP